MKSIQSIALLALAAITISVMSCNSSKHHWHRTTKEERQMKKGK